MYPYFVSYGTSLPSNPGNGELAQLVDNINYPTFVWSFRYNCKFSPHYICQYYIVPFQFFSISIFVFFLWYNSELVATIRLGIYWYFLFCISVFRQADCRTSPFIMSVSSCLSETEMSVSSSLCVSVSSSLSLSQTGGAPLTVRATNAMQLVNAW